MTAPLLPGAEPWSAPGGPYGVLVMHGFTGNPNSMRGLAAAFADAGFGVELPLLPGHGTAVEDLVGARWDDWTATVEAAYGGLASRHDKVAVAGLSMGGTLATFLAARHPEIAAAVTINPMIETPAESYLDMLRQLITAGTVLAPGIGSDIARPGVVESAYPETPLEAALSFFAGVAQLETHLGDVACPMLICTSRQDHVVPPASSELLAARVSGPVQRLALERSYHVATLDYDAAEIERVAVDFVTKALA